MRKTNFVFPVIIGTALEYYDFTIFAAFSAEIAVVFFPKQDIYLSILFSLSVFAIGFLMRPLGAIIFGHIGDKVGRKNALMFSINCMAIPTFMIGILPGYEILGMWAPTLLVVLRLIQGLSIGGEGAGSAIFILEHNQGKKLGYLGGIITASNFIGAFLATIVGLGISYYTTFNINWRYSFILGGLFGFFIFYLRKNIIETPIFKEIEFEDRFVKLPLIIAIRDSRREMILSGCFGSLVGAVANMILAYINILFNQIYDLDSTIAFMYSALCIGSFIVLLPIFGLWADRIGYIRSAVHGSIATIVLSMPLFVIMSLNYQTLTIISVIVFGALGAWICAPAYPAMLEIFPAQHRYSGIAFSFNMGIAIFGGTAPVISTYLVKVTNLICAPSFYLMILCALFCYSYLWFIKSSILTWNYWKRIFLYSFRIAIPKY